MKFLTFFSAFSVSSSFYLKLAVFIFLIQSCASAASETVFTTVSPVSWFVKAIARSDFDVVTLVPPGADAHVYEPKPAQMKQLAGAKIYFAVGELSPFEASALPKIAEQNPSLQIVELGEFGEHSEHHNETHSHHEYHDPHIWTSVNEGKRILEAVRQAFIKYMPEKTEEFNARHAEAMNNIDELDEFLKGTFAPFRGKRFIVYHPAWSGLADDYGIVQTAIEQDGKEPKISALAELINSAKADGIKTIFASPSDPKNTVETFAREIGADVVYIDPLASDWLDNMRKVGIQISESL